MIRTLLATLACLMFCVGGRTAEAPTLFGVPLKPDPPPAVDGRLDEWSGVPNALTVADKEHCVYSPAKWQSPADLSARVWLAWRNEHLYLAADVTDDRHVQKRAGDAMWQGDHIELYLDLLPGFEAERRAFGEGQMHFGFSPGSLERTGDPLTDVPPQGVVFRPAGAAATGVQVAAQKTERGYVLEAAVPWTLLWSLAKRDAKTPEIGLSFAIEVGISDTDGTEPTQEKMMTLLTGEWAHRRDRLMPAVLAPTNGEAPAGSQAVGGVEILQAAQLATGEKKEIRFAAPAIPKGKEAILSLRARLETPKVAGYTRALRVKVNGKALDASRLTNKQPVEEMADGRDQPMAAGDLFTTAYAPDFDLPDRHASYAFRRAKVCLYDLRVTDLLRDGENVLTIEHGADRAVTYKLVVGDVRLEMREPIKPRERRPAPTGALPVYEPARSHRVAYTLKEQADGALVITLGKESFRVESQFSTPKPEWVRGTNAYFRLRRQVERKDEAILIRDTFTNLTQENLPLMQRHRAFPAGQGSAYRKVWLGGLSPSTLTGLVQKPGNPTTFGVTAGAGIGLIALDDVFQVHVTNFSADDQVGLADNDFVLKPGATHTAEWAILPTAVPDYYAFLNAARRLRDCNFTLQGSFCFLRADPRESIPQWSDKQLTDFIRYKDAHFVCDSCTYPSYKGHHPHGTAFQTLDWSYVKGQIGRLRGLVPEAKHVLYFHCFLDVLEGAEQKYADARLLRSDGQQADYGKPIYKIFVPTESNAFGRDVTRNVDLILGPTPRGFGCDGVYWDEFEYSAVRYHYQDFSKEGGLPWDGVSADIDPKKMTISRLKSSVTLISQPYRLALAKRILAQGPLIANGQPHTRTMVNLHFPRFVETGSISHCADAQIFSPIALGDHLTERSERDCYRQMLRALDYGCVYYWYDDVHVGLPTHPHLTRYMFPVTPVELHQGFLIGKERILTNRSGLFGWGDRSKHEVHVFNEEGKEVPGHPAPTVERDGKTYTELRLAEDWSAAIVRR